jgi:hypothetical protein
MRKITCKIQKVWPLGIYHSTMISNILYEDEKYKLLEKDTSIIRICMCCYVHISQRDIKNIRDITNIIHIYINPYQHYICFHGNDYEECHLLECDTMWLYKNWRFGGPYHLQLLLMLFIACWFFWPLWWRQYAPLKRRFLQQPRGITSQKTAFFVLASNHTKSLKPDEYLFTKFCRLLVNEIMGNPLNLHVTGVSNRCDAKIETAYAEITADWRRQNHYLPDRYIAFEHFYHKNIMLHHILGFIKCGL